MNWDLKVELMDIKSLKSQQPHSPTLVIKIFYNKDLTESLNKISFLTLLLLFPALMMTQLINLLSSLAKSLKKLAEDLFLIF